MLARDAEQAVHLVIHDRNILVVVAQVDGPGYWNVSIRVGSRIGMINTGSAMSSSLSLATRPAP